jgi:hypothetical protein
MEPDDTGVYTDSAEFVHVIPECTNISVGYYKEHTHFEHQDIDHLVRLCIAVCKIDWEILPTKRDPNKIDYKSYSYKSYGYSTYDKEYKKSESGYSTYDNWSGWDKSPARSRRKKYQKTYGYYDDFYFEDDDKYQSTEPGIGRAFLDDLNNDFTDEYYYRNYEQKTDGNKYESLKQELHKDIFTKEEKNIIKDQFLKPMGEYDSNFTEEFIKDDFQF